MGTDTDTAGFLPSFCSGTLKAWSAAGAVGHQCPQQGGSSARFGLPDSSRSRGGEQQSPLSGNTKLGASALIGKLEDI